MPFTLPSPPRLPDVGSDDGTWGQILNAFLEVSINNPDGTLKTSAVSAAGAEMTTNKDTDGTLSANSDTKYSSQKAVKTYVDTGLSTKAVDSAVVHKAGNETITGLKTVTNAFTVDNGSGSIKFGGYAGGFISINKASGDAQPAILIRALDNSVNLGGGGSTPTDIKIKRTGVNQLDFGSAKLQSVADPVTAQDVATKTYVDTAQTLDEKVANKDTDITLSANSDTKYPSQKAVKTYVDNNSGYTSPDLDANKPLATAVKAGTTYFSTDINGGTLYVSDGTSWLEAAAGINDSGGKEIMINRFGGSATTGSTQTFTQSVPTEITGSASTFTMPVNGSPVILRAALPVVIGNTTCSYSITLTASTDNSHFITIGGVARQFVSPTTSGIGSAIGSIEINSRLPVPTFNSSASSYYKLEAGDTVYFKAHIGINQVGSNYRDDWSSSNSYAIGDGVKDGTTMYVCKATRTPTATRPSADGSYWTAFTSTAFEAYQPYFGGYMDSHTSVTRV